MPMSTSVSFLMLLVRIHTNYRAPLRCPQDTCEGTALKSLVETRSIGENFQSEMRNVPVDMLVRQLEGQFAKLSYEMYRGASGTAAGRSTTPAAFTKTSVLLPRRIQSIA